MQRSSITPEMRQRIFSWILGVSLGMSGYAALLVVSSGKWNWFWGWVYMILVILAIVLHVVILVPLNPALLADRAGGLRQPGTKRWDIWLTMTAGLAFISILIVAGLDERRGWTGEISIGWHIAGIVLFVMWWIFFLWAMVSNPFFSEGVRIQEGHRVATGGPYRLVRHPGYLGNLIGCIGQPLLFGSWWAFIPAVLTMLAFTIRAALEDKTLLKELDGYADYARRVHFRLIPGIW